MRKRLIAGFRRALKPETMARACCLQKGFTITRMTISAINTAGTSLMIR